MYPLFIIWLVFNEVLLILDLGQLQGGPGMGTSFTLNFNKCMFGL